MKTDEVIQNLTNELRAGDKNFYRVSFVIWSVSTAAILILFFYIMPIRADLSSKLISPPFQIETLLLLALFWVATRLAYRSVIPGLLRRQEQFIGLALVVAFGALMLSKLSVVNLLSQLRLELNFYRGHCGPILIVLAGLQTLVGMFVARRAASTNLYRTGFWLGISAGAMALIALQFICVHENFPHLVLWHALPVMLLVGSASIAARRFLRW